jgi:D-xylose transport system permease protein
MSVTSENPSTEDTGQMTASDFEVDARQAATLADVGRDYLNRLRGGDMGSLPALLGLVVLFIVFSSAHDRFLTTYNMANLVVQAASICVLAMGLVFVLLLGEIDLSAGVAGGASATITRCRSSTTAGRGGQRLSPASPWASSSDSRSACSCHCSASRRSW